MGSMAPQGSSGELRSSTSQPCEETATADRRSAPGECAVGPETRTSALVGFVPWVRKNPETAATPPSSGTCERGSILLKTHFLRLPVLMTSKCARRNGPSSEDQGSVRFIWWLDFEHSHFSVPAPAARSQRWGGPPVFWASTPDKGDTSGLSTAPGP